MNRAKDGLIRLLRKLFDVASAEVTRSLADDIRRDLMAAQFLATLAPPGHYLPWSRAALSPGAVATILNDIVLNRRRRIVELGSGISTLWIARLLKQQMGHVWSIEQDANWMGVVEAMLKREDLLDQVTMIHTPLAPSPLSLTQGLWYQADILQSSLAGIEIDLLVVDGPENEGADPLIRYPAVPFFKDYMAEACAIVLDDARRKGEKRIIAQWQSEVGISFTLRGSIALGLRGAHYKPFM